MGTKVRKPNHKKKKCKLFSSKSLRNGKMFVILQHEKRRSATAWINCAFIKKRVDRLRHGLTTRFFYVLKTVLDMLSAIAPDALGS